MRQLFKFNAKKAEQQNKRLILLPFYNLNKVQDGYMHVLQQYDVKPLSINTTSSTTTTQPDDTIQPQATAERATASLHLQHFVLIDYEDCNNSSSKYAYSNLNSDFILWHHPA